MREWAGLASCSVVTGCQEEEEEATLVEGEEGLTSGGASGASSADMSAGGETCDKVQGKGRREEEESCREESRSGAAAERRGRPKRNVALLQSQWGNRIHANAAIHSAYQSLLGVQHLHNLRCAVQADGSLRGGRQLTKLVNVRIGCRTAEKN